MTRAAHRGRPSLDRGPRTCHPFALLMETFPDSSAHHRTDPSARTDPPQRRKTGSAAEAGSQPQDSRRPSRSPQPGQGLQTTDTDHGQGHTHAQGNQPAHDAGAPHRPGPHGARRHDRRRRLELPRLRHGAPLDRFDFYERARAATIIVHTQETRPYGCRLPTKGVLPSFGPEPAS